jgi:heme/copper-type cytochrome/quinol oxidase subunit 2
MPLGEREALTGFVTMLIVIGMVLWVLTGQHVAGRFDGPDALQLWARMVLKLIAVSLAIAVGINILVHVVYRVVTGEKPHDQKDERDRELERTALTWSWYLLSFGILAVIVDLAMGASAFRAMNLIISLCAISELFKDALKLWLYRRGG